MAFTNRRSTRSERSDAGERRARSTWALILLAGVLLPPAASATPPYGDPNQPYDRLPGTWETPHIKWARPYAGGKLNALFIIPYCNSREVVETAQRLDLRYTVIMNASRNAWDQGSSEGPTATPLTGVEAQVVLGDIARRRLSLGFRYDVIVIGKVSWLIMPADVRGLVLEHVARGTGLVYVCPNRLEHKSRKKATTADPAFTKLFETNTLPGAEAVFRGLPVDVMPLHRIEAPADYKPFVGAGRTSYAQRSACVTATRHGKGRVLALDYFDEVIGFHLHNSLTPYIPYIPDTAMTHDPVMFDLSYALLARCMLWAGAKPPIARASVTVQAPPTALKAPTGKDWRRHGWEPKTPMTVVARADLPKAKAAVTVTGKAGPYRCAYTIRTRMGDVRTEGQATLQVPSGKPATVSVPLPSLARGTYLLDVRVLDQADRVADFASKSLRVESAQHVASVKTAKEAYRHGETLSGQVTFAQPLGPGHAGEAWAVDTWGRTVARVPVKLNDGRTGGTFCWRVHRPLCRLWDVYAGIRDKRGLVDTARTWVGLPKWTFDDYMWMLIFSPTPGSGWKGNFYGTRARQYGVNATFTYLIYGYLKQYEHNARFHLDSVSYAEHMGEHYPTVATGSDKENTTSCLAEVSRMARHIADTGQLLDPKQFPYRLPQGAWSMGADNVNDRIPAYKASAKFGSPFYVLTGENYLLGEMGCREYSGFAPLYTKLFGQWCREQYKGDLKALNAEWGSNLKSWDQVRGILLNEAVEQKQLPRWVDFRYFMRSRVWSQYFIDWTDMLRRFVPEARTGRCGHDHYDFTRHRKHMTCSKLYICPNLNAEWRDALIPELPQSFSGDRGFYLASWSMIYWQYSFTTPVNNARWPWKVLFMGLNGFDWERCLPAASLGGESCMTPDFSEPLPFFQNVSREVQHLQRGIGALTIAAKPVRSKVAVLWAPYNHYISRLHPFQENGFSGTWLYNASVIGGAHSDALALLNSLRIRPTFVGPEDLADGGLEKRGFRALVLPYSKGMSQAEADAIRQFVKQGGLLIGENTPGIYSEHGRELKTPRLEGLFPTFKRKHVVRHGKGHAAYVAGEINGYLSRFERCDYTGSESVAALLKELAGIAPPVELIDGRGIARRDTLMPLFTKGGTTLVGLLRAITSQDKEPETTVMQFGKPYHVWDVRRQSYCGQTDAVRVRLDMMPRYYALLPVNPLRLVVRAEPGRVEPGKDVVLAGSTPFSRADATAGKTLGQAVHLRVYSPTGDELEHFRKNVVFEGDRFRHVLPISLSAPPGRYTVQAEHAVTGMKATTGFDVQTGEGE